MSQDAQKKEVTEHFRLLNVLTGFFVASLLLANVTSSKFFSLGPFDFPGGAIIFPISFIFGDVLTEVYGYAQARRVIWTGFGCQIMAAIVYGVVGALPSASFWTDQVAYDTVLGVMPRITLASIVAYFCGEFCNSWCMSVMKFRSRGKRGLEQARRFTLSTVIGEGVDSLVFMVVAFVGIYDLKTIAASTLTLYLFKVGYEVVALPISLSLSNWIKRYEKIDIIDSPETVRYNPFFIQSRPMHG